jgi:hypothetical protein
MEYYDSTKDQGKERLIAVEFLEEFYYYSGIID